MLRTSSRSLPPLGPCGDSRPPRRRERRCVLGQRRRRRADANRRSNVAPRRRRQTPARAAAAETSAAVERKLLTVIVQSPAGKLPPALIDGKTGLAKNNLQAVCTPSSDAQSFVCVVTSAIQPGAPPCMRTTVRPGAAATHSRGTAAAPVSAISSRGPARRQLSRRARCHA